MSLNIHFFFSSGLVTKLQDEAKALELCKSKVRQRKLPMEVIDAEYQWCASYKCPEPSVINIHKTGIGVNSRSISPLRSVSTSASLFGNFSGTIIPCDISGVVLILLLDCTKREYGWLLWVVWVATTSKVLVYTPIPPPGLGQSYTVKKLSYVSFISRSPRYVSMSGYIFSSCLFKRRFYLVPDAL